MSRGVRVALRSRRVRRFAGGARVASFGPEGRPFEPRISIESKTDGDRGRARRAPKRVPRSTGGVSPVRPATVCLVRGEE